MIKTSNLKSAAIISAALLTSQTAGATDVEVTIQNLSTETIVGSSSSFPARLLPGESKTVKLNFPHNSSWVYVSYSTPTKTCDFEGWHRVYSRTNAKWDKEATASGGRNNCFALQSVSRWSEPYDYRLTFQMTD